MKKTIDEYIKSLPAERQEAVSKLLQVIRKNIPAGFKEVMTTSPGFAVPLSAFPAGYHCTPATPLGFVSIASMKNAITLHHFGMYMNPKLTQWFVDAYTGQVKSRLDMGKGCIRFKKMDQIPYSLIGELMGKISMQDYIDGYENALQQIRSRKT